MVSFGGDDDSREFKSMQVSTNLLFSSCNPMAPMSTSSISDASSFPSEWRHWFGLKNPTKLKSRLIKPSSILPLGGYTGVHHLAKSYSQNFQQR